MAFILYKWEADSKGFRVFERLKEVKLAGDGPIASYVHDVHTAKATTPLRWHATEAEILSRLGTSDREHAFIIDVKPRKENRVFLCHLREIWGFSYKEWTPIALRLEELFGDKEVQDAKEFKQRFSDEKCPRQQLHEFLYLQGGTKKGTWLWGPGGRTNGALLPPDALEYFMEVLANSLKSHSTRK